MASETGRKAPARRKRPRLNKHFYLRNAQGKLELHKNLHINRGTDVVTTWHYDNGKVIKYNYTDTLKHARPAFSMKQVAQLLNRKSITLETAILAGNIEEPQFSYTIDERRRKIQFFWSEEDVIAAHEYFSSVHYGRPRKDGMVNPFPIPTLRELRAMMDDEEILYVHNGEGFVPTWKAK